MLSHAHQMDRYCLISSKVVSFELKQFPDFCDVISINKLQ
jgi:hypothetical protein